jgi:superoxide dismutase
MVSEKVSAFEDAQVAKHRQAYVTTANNMAKGTEWKNEPVEEVVKGTFGKNQTLFNNAAQHQSISGNR